MGDGEQERDGGTMEGNASNACSTKGKEEERRGKGDGVGDGEGALEEEHGRTGEESEKNGSAAKRQRSASSGSSCGDVKAPGGGGDAKQSSAEHVRAAQAAGLTTVKLGSNGISLLLWGQEEGDGGERERGNGQEKGSREAAAATGSDGGMCGDVTAADAEGGSGRAARSAAHPKATAVPRHPKDGSHEGGGARVVGVVSRLLADVAAGRRKPLK